MKVARLVVATALAVSTGIAAATHNPFAGYEDRWTTYADFDDVLDDTYQTLMERLSPTQKIAVRDDERAWIKYRNQKCGFGTEGACSIALIKARTIVLDAKLRQTLPKVGTCMRTTVKATGHRFDGDPKSGSTIDYANGLHQIDYDLVSGIVHSRPGDPVEMCVTSVPTDCPPADFRGITYRTTNFRTHGKWEAADSQHECGGA